MEDLIKLAKDFIDSSEQLAMAAKLCDKDPIKQEMIKGVHDLFQKMQLRFLGLQVMVKQKKVSRDLIIAEMKEITKMNKDISTQIENKLISLSN